MQIFINEMEFQEKSKTIKNQPNINRIDISDSIISYIFTHDQAYIIIQGRNKTLVQY